jgi:hypothetical protein
MPTSDFYKAGCDAAALRLKIALELPSLGGLMPKITAFGKGQWGAAKELGANLRGGLGGKMNPAVEGLGRVAPGAEGPALNPDMAQFQRQKAMGNLRTLAPSIGIGAGMYGLHRMHQNAENQQRARQMQQSQMMGGYTPYGG